MKTKPLVILFLAMGLSACGGGGGVGPPPTITKQPQSATVNAGQTATFTVVATGASGYQWQRNGQNIAGATAASYVLAVTSSQNNGDVYQVIASNSGGSATSANVSLRVTGVSVIAGQPGGMGYADGPAAQARFWGPIALAFDGSGNLFVADYNAVRMITPDGMVSTVAGTPRVCGNTPGTGSTAIMCYPYSLTTDSAGNVYAGDNFGVVWQISPAGVANVLAGGFYCPFGLAMVGSALFVSDQCKNMGTITRVQGGSSSLYASVGLFPVGLSTDSLQNLYVANDTVVQSVTAVSAMVSNIAGTPNVPGSADGLGAAARFGCANSPWPGEYVTYPRFIGAFGIATTSAQLSYVSDFCNQTIRTVTSTGTVSTLAGATGSPGSTDGPGATARFRGPAGMAMDASGNVFVADYGNALIRKITPAGAVSTYAGHITHYGSTDGAGAAASFWSPRGVTADAMGNLYIADGNQTIRKITPGGAVSTLAGSVGVVGATDGAGTAAQFQRPAGIAADTAGNLFVADSGNNAIREVTPAGTVSTLVGGLLRPLAVVTDATSDVLFADRNGVYMIDPAGIESTILATPQWAQVVQGIAVGSGGMLFVTTRTGVYSLTPGMPLTLIAGGGAFGAADGTGSAAHFDHLAGIVLAGDGNLYVADQFNSTIRRVTLSGVVTTPVGTSTMPMGISPGGLPARINSPWGLALLSTGPAVSLAVVDQWESVVLRVDLP